MKKCISVLVLLALVSVGAFAQFFVSAGVNTNTAVSAVEMMSIIGGMGIPAVTSSVVPVIGLGFGIGNIDILANITFSSVSYTDEENTPTIEKAGILMFGIGAGVAPKVAVTENLTLSLPIMFGYSSSNISMEESNGTNKTTYKFSQDKISFTLGGRANYAFSGNWSAFIGFDISLFEYYLNMYIDYENTSLNISTSTTYDLTAMKILGGGNIVFGIKVTF